MELTPRELQASIATQTPPKAVVIFGARQTGKTTLLQGIVSSSAAWFSGDVPSDLERLSLFSSGDVKTLLYQADAIVIDEAQRVPGIGLLLKRMVDLNKTLEHPVKIFAAGSSSLDLAEGVKESAVGRLIKREMWPFSVTELAAAPESSWAKVLRDIEWHLVNGMLPEVCNEQQNAKLILKHYTEDILFKDVFALGGIRLPNKFIDLVRLLALNVGSEVSFDGLANETGLNRNTVADYVTLLEECFIVKVCPSYAKNLANELKKKGKKIYFCDNGIRNAIINNFDPLSTRQDKGALWENFFFMERVKYYSYRQDSGRVYFWRTSKKKSNKQDFIEVVDGKMEAFECKISPSSKSRLGPDFHQAYPDCPIRTVAPATFLQVWLESEEYRKAAV